VTGRDVTIPRPANETRRRRLLVAAAFASVALLAIGMAVGSRLARSDEPDVRTPPAAQHPVRPTVRTNERTPTGAVAAAAQSITAFDGTVLLDPVRLRAVVSTLASREARPQLLAAFAQASAQTRTKLGADTAPRPLIVLRSIPVGYRVERFSPDEAAVSVWYVGIVGSGATVEPQQSWRTQQVSLVWERGAWRVASFASARGPTPPLSTAEPVESAGDLFGAIPRFEEFNSALP
jgi:hypothetical protein